MRRRKLTYHAHDQERPLALNWPIAALSLGNPKPNTPPPPLWQRLMDLLSRQSKRRTQ